MIWLTSKEWDISIGGSHVIHLDVQFVSVDITGVAWKDDIRQ